MCGWQGSRRPAPAVNLLGYGHYHETYEKIDGQLRIKTSTLTRLRADIFNTLVSVYVSDRIKKVAGIVGRRCRQMSHAASKSAAATQIRIRARPPGAPIDY